jgi:asparagine synthase (glutamine-hydrolysing)
VERRDAQKTFPELREEFLGLLEESVRIRMISDVPLGAFLSGGIDSSSIVAMMARNSARPVKTFSIGFEEKSYSELEYSRRVADLFRTDHYVRTLSPDIADLVLTLSRFFDEPLGDFSNFPTFLVSQTAREKVTVVLSGDGGDEIFGGYEHYIAQRIGRVLDWPLLRLLQKPLSKTSRWFMPSDLKKGAVNRIKRFSEGLGNSGRNRHFRWMLFLSAEQKRRLYAPSFLREDFLLDICDREPFAGFFESSRRFDGINRDLYLDLKTYLVDDIMVKVDRMSMATSLEARAPLLDHKMVEFAFSLPPEMKVRGATTKWFFKKAMEGILPNEVIYRRKEGFSIPIKSWLKRELKDLMLEYLSEKRIRDLGIFDPGYVASMVDDHLRHRENHSHRLWALILFHLWHDHFVRDRE